jgi:hypothetical protein
MFGSIGRTPFAFAFAAKFEFAIRPARSGPAVGEAAGFRWAGNFGIAMGQIS